MRLVLGTLESMRLGKFRGQCCGGGSISNNGNHHVSLEERRDYLYGVDEG